MLEWKWCGIHFRISLWFPAAVIAMLTFDETTLAVQCLLASFVHEGGHFLAMAAVGDRPARLCLGIFGMRVERRTESPIGYGCAALVSVAGPVANLLCCAVFFVCNSDEAALIHGILAVFHLLPVLSLDGGEALYSLLCLLGTERRAHTVMLAVSAAVLFPLSILGFYVLLQTGYNFSLLLLTVYLIALLIFKEKR